MMLDQQHRVGVSGGREPLPSPTWERAAREAVASVRAEGLEPGPDTVATLRAISAGETCVEDAVAAILSPYRSA
ncbi:MULTISPECIES: antitoxin VbhA family protein [unclassified Pseudonocardia]|uniref:antitoxin VbhA family protein n=1 Tax=unclassified Pseudonocardia TaxID=2619320 RepID=UPI000B221058|nr:MULTISPECIES: antitoxin VbhA family protein [unclassified Pseudonocardia]